MVVNKIKLTIGENDPLICRLFLMDCRMSFMDGYETTNILR